VRLFASLLLIGAGIGWDGIKGVIGGHASSAALFFVRAAMVAVAWFADFAVTRRLGTVYVRGGQLSWSV
jgi:hypothetical protein